MPIRKNVIISSGESIPITINGKTGTNITLSKSDIGLDAVVNAEQVKKTDVGVLVPAIQANGKIRIEETPVIAANLVSVANKAERLALPINENLTLCLQGDTQWLWSLNANLDALIESNWKDCGSTAASVVSVNGVTGMVTINCANIGAVPVDRTVNSKVLNDNITLTIGDIITLPNDTTQFLAGDGTWKTPAGSIAGTNGQVQFNDNSASGADSNLTWDNTNKRLGVGTETPSNELHVSSTKTTTPTKLSVKNNFVGQNGSGDDYEISTIDLGDEMFNSSISTKIPNGAWGDGCRLDFSTPAGSNSNVQIPRLSILPFNGRVGIKTTTPTTDFEVNGYTKLGSDAPSVKFKEISGTTPSTVSTMGTYAHGLTKSKILGVQIVVENSGGTLILPHNGTPDGSGDYYYAQVTDTNLAIHTAGNSTSILSKPFRAIITYKE